MPPPKVSCIVPAFNAAPFLADALSSIFFQSAPPSEVIVVDDGSTDDTRAVVERFGRGTVYVAQANSGPATARNRGLSIASGEFVSFLDQDDLWHPEKLERQLSRFRARPEIDLSITHIELFWSDELAAEREAHRDRPRVRRTPGYSTTTLLARRESFDRVGKLDTGLRFSDATDWFLRAEEQGLELELMPDVLVRHRMHSRNLTRQRDASCDEFLHLLKRRLDRDRRSTRKPER